MDQAHRMTYGCLVGLGSWDYEEQVDTLSSLTCFPGAIPQQFLWCVRVDCHWGLKMP